MKKQIVLCLFLIIVLLFTNLCLAEYSSIKVSPLKTELNLRIGAEQNCTIFYVLPDKNMQITSRWSKSNPGEEDKYNLSKEQIKLKINYTRLEYGRYEFCFEPQRAGMFYGLIFFQSEDSLVRMGTWINLNITQTSPIETISLITGNVIGKTNNTNFWLGVILILLLIILFLLIKRTKVLFS